MTITATDRPDRIVEEHRTTTRPGTPRPKNSRPGTKVPSGFGRLAGPMFLLAGIMVTIAQLVMLPFDVKEHIKTSQSVQFQAGGVLYMIGFCALLLGLIGAYAWIAPRTGRFGMVAFSAAVVGTFLLGGDLWFETFAIPSFADGPAAHQVLNGDPSVLLGIGAIASYLSFAVGWALFGIAGWRSRVFPKVLSGGLVIGGLIGFNALLAPFAIPLALVVGALGVWMIRAAKVRTA